MSCTEKHIGTLREVTLSEGMTPEDWYKKQCLDNNIEEDCVGPNSNQYNSWREAYMDNIGWDFPDSTKHIIVNDRIYEMTDHIKLDECEDLCKFWKNADGTISFAAEFYNGGTCLSELVECELEKFV